MTNWSATRVITQLGQAGCSRAAILGRGRCDQVRARQERTELAMGVGRLPRPLTGDARTSVGSFQGRSRVRAASP